jgi:transcriptional regulator with XRE-family HTH domain
MQQTTVESRLTVGRNIKKFCRSSRMSQESLANDCGIYRTYLSRIEAGAANPTLNILFAVAMALKVDICDLFTDFERAAQ